MRKMLISATLPLLLFGGCSTLQGATGGHDAHHPENAAVMQDAGAPALAAEGMETPSTTPNGVSQEDKAGMPMSNDAKMMSSGNDAMKNCPMMDDKTKDAASH